MQVGVVVGAVMDAGGERPAGWRMLAGFAALVTLCVSVGAGVGSEVAFQAHRPLGVEAVQRAMLALDPSGVDGSLEIVVAMDGFAEARLWAPSSPVPAEIVDVALARGWELVDADSSVSVLRRGSVQADVWEDRVVTWSPPRHLSAGLLVGGVGGVAGAAVLARRRRIGVLGLLFGVAATPFAASALLDALSAATPTFGGTYGLSYMLLDRLGYVLLAWGVLLAAAHGLGADVVTPARRTKERLDAL